jgi:hypothetical protein
MSVKYTLYQLNLKREIIITYNSGLIKIYLSSDDGGFIAKVYTIGHLCLSLAPKNRNV